MLAPVRFLDHRSVAVVSQRAVGRALPVAFGQGIVIEPVSPAAGGFDVGWSLLSDCLFHECGEGTRVEQIVEDFIGFGGHAQSSVSRLPRRA
jgi:hypothetical protein